MDNWQVAQNYVVAAAIAGTVGGYYYYTSSQRKPNRTGSSTGLVTRRSETDLRARRNTAQRDVQATSAPVSRPDSTSKPAKKRKVKTTPAPSQQRTTAAVDDKPVKESDMSVDQFAQQMLQARKGANLQSHKSEGTRVRTVKPKILSPASSASIAGETGTDADDEANSPPLDPTGIADMLEHQNTKLVNLRITEPSLPKPERAPRQQKEQVVESKKQRQHRKKNEERKAQAADDELLRKALEEKQRRTAREARGEPAKNGVAKPPTSSPWETRTPQPATPASSTLLDTFDAESTSSSNGGLDASTAATSTTEGEQAHLDGLSEEDQMAAAIKESGDDAGWTTVATAKKSRKPESSSGAATPNLTSGKKMNGQVKTGGFAALDHPSNDPAEWDA